MIDPKLQAELRAKFNPDGSDLRKMQLRMLDMLKYIDKICRENDIKYWLSSGTCLGAVRHGGFIPWDDDVDIEMEKKDYDKFLTIARRDINSKFVLQNEFSDPEYLHTFTKLRDLNSEVDENSSTDRWNKYRGCYVDIFVMTPSVNWLIHRICGILWSRTLFPLATIKEKKIRVKLIRSFRTFYRYLFKVIDICKSNKSRKYRHVLGTGFSKHRMAPDIAETIRVPFEDTVLPIPIGYKDYLKIIYGNYEDLPEIESIHPHFKNLKICN